MEEVFIKDLGLAWDCAEPLLLVKNVDPTLGPPWLAHLTFQQYIDLGYIGTEQLQGYHKFCTVRDPYARVVSIYKYLGFSHAVSFPKFVRSCLGNALEPTHELFYFCRPQVDYVHDKHGVIAVDQVIRLEELNSKFSELAAIIGLTERELPHVNKSGYTPFLKRLWRRFKFACKGVYELGLGVDSSVCWTDELKEIVQQRYRQDFEVFGYDM